MPIIIVASLNGDDDSRSHPAAALMGTMHRMLSEPTLVSPVNAPTEKTEKTSPGNPKELTLRQHVFPTRSIERFTKSNGRVAVQSTKHLGRTRNAKPSDAIFCANRAWDQRAETGYMKRIEDDFQRVASSIVSGQLGSVSADQKPIVDRMYALWYMRARYRQIKTQEAKLIGIPGDSLTKEEEEVLESKGVVFTRKGGLVPYRQINGLNLQIRINGYVSDLAKLSRWGVIQTQDGELVVPDIPTYLFLPLSPTVMLASNCSDGIITKANLAEVNHAVLASCQTYCFARDFSFCPF